MFSILIALQKTYKIMLKILWRTVTSQFKNITISCTNTECEWILITGSYHTSLLQSKKPKKIYKQTVNEKIQSKTEETLIEYLPHNKEVAF